MDKVWTNYKLKIKKVEIINNYIRNIVKYYLLYDIAKYCIIIDIKRFFVRKVCMDRFDARDSGLIISPLTTGDCAAAAARAAAASLLFKFDYEYVTIQHDGNTRTISVYKDAEKCNNNESHFYAVMEGGMAPDIREKADIHVSVSKVTDFRTVESKAFMDIRYGNLFLYAGEGIGIASVDSFTAKRGQALIEKDARKLIFDAVAGVCEISDGAQPLLIKVSCPEGMLIAAKQAVGQNGFMGGIGIMGSYGTISSVHQRDIASSIENQIQAQIDMGVTSILVSPGDYCADKIYEGIHVSLKTAINCFNFPGSAIDAACEAGVENLLLVGNVGKLVKMAAGIMNTNSYASDGRREIFAAHTAIVGGTSSQVRTVMGCTTCDEILALLNNWGLRDRVMASIMGKINEAVGRRCNGRLRYGVALFSEEFGLLGATADTRNVLVKVSQDQYALSLKLK